MSHEIETIEDTPRYGLAQAITSAINSFSAENGSNTPDFILVEYLLACLAAFDAASRAREAWYGKELRIGHSETP